MAAREKTLEDTVRALTSQRDALEATKKDHLEYLDLLRANVSQLQGELEEAQKHEQAREDYDDMRTCVDPGTRHLFLPAPGSSGLRDSLYDAVFGL